MKKPFYVTTGINKVEPDTVIEAIQALGLDHDQFILVSVGGLSGLFIDANYEVDPFKLTMLRTTLEAFNEKK